MSSVVGKEQASADRGCKDTVLLAFKVEDVDDAVEVLEKKEVEFVTQPHNRDAWFMRVANLRDPDGNLLEINENLPLNS